MELLLENNESNFAKVQACTRDLW